MTMRVLIAEDEALQRRSLAQMVQQACPVAEVVLAADGLEAVAHASQSPPDLVLLDIRMPRMDGLAAAQRIRQAAPSAALFIITAHDQFDYARQAIGIGVEQYLLKPVAPEDIDRCVDSVRQTLAARAEQTAQQAETRQMLADAMPLLAAQFVRDLCLGSIGSQAEYRRRASVFDLTDEPGLAIAVGFDRQLPAVTPGAPPVPGETELELARRRATREIEAAFSRFPGTVLTGRTRHDELVVLLTLRTLRAAGRSPLEVVRRILRSALDNCVQFGLQMSAGIGTPASGGLSIWRSYMAAQRARERARLMGIAGPQIIAAKDLGDESDQWSRYPMLAERGLAEAVRAGVADQVAGYLPQLADFFTAQPAGSGNDRRPPSAVRSRGLECLAILARAASDAGADPARVYELSTAAIDRALRAVGGAELAGAVADLAHALALQVAGAREARQSGLAARAAAYLEGHYPEDVSLTRIAEELHVSSFYLSHIFRQSKGVTFSDYLANLRIDEAKRLLTITGLPVIEVAARVGYREPNYFGRVFKKATGMTPLAWRRASRATGCD